MSANLICECFFLHLFRVFSCFFSHSFRSLSFQRQLISPSPPAAAAALLTTDGSSAAIDDNQGNLVEIVVRFDAFETMAVRNKDTGELLHEAMTRAHFKSVRTQCCSATLLQNFRPDSPLLSRSAPGNSSPVWKILATAHRGL